MGKVNFEIEFENHEQLSKEEILQKSKQVVEILNGLPDEKYNHLMKHPLELQAFLKERNMNIKNISYK